MSCNIIGHMINFGYFNDRCYAKYIVLLCCIGKCYCQGLLWQILWPILVADVIAKSMW